jgi:histidine ammonia-lyase
VLACELVAAVRALRLQGTAPAALSEPALAAAFELAAGALPVSTADRPLDTDLALAQGLLAPLAPFAALGGPFAVPRSASP